MSQEFKKLIECLETEQGNETKYKVTNMFDPEIKTYMNWSGSYNDNTKHVTFTSMAEWNDKVYQVREDDKNGIVTTTVRLFYYKRKGEYKMYSNMKLITDQNVIDEVLKQPRYYQLYSKNWKGATPVV